MSPGQTVKCITCMNQVVISNLWDRLSIQSTGPGAGMEEPAHQILFRTPRCHFPFRATLQTESNCIHLFSSPWTTIDCLIMKCSCVSATALWNHFFPPKFHFSILICFFVCFFQPFRLILPLQGMCSTVFSLFFLGFRMQVDVKCWIYELKYEFISRISSAHKSFGKCLALCFGGK